MTVEYIDARRGHLYCVDDHQRVARIPVDYVAAGGLAHAYAMTIHKAQGATIERTLVLADDTMAAEHAYTALSRAAIRTDLYLESGDTVDREAHAPVRSARPAERVAQSMRRSAAQSLAIEQNPGVLVPIDALRAERERLQHQLVDRPPDRSIELRQLQQRISSTRDTLEHAAWRQHDAQQRLDQLGGIGRHLHRHDRKSLEQLEHSAAADIDSLTAELSPLVAEHRQLTIEQRDVTRWDETHAPELERVAEIDRTIRLHHIATRALQAEPPSMTRRIERSIGLEL
jgi:chromosome segregation ATPase